ncbi:MAG: hypothetical protein U0Q12_17255 [Vicinamibacterales bacterium]
MTPDNADVPTASATLTSRERASERPRPPALVLILVAALAFAAALAADLPISHGGIKGDEATYVSMAMSLAYDGDLAFDRRDVERFRASTHAGPEGIFLKLGRRLDLHVTTRWPFIVNAGSLESGAARAYFGKAWVHALLAAPFVRLFGLNGLVALNALLLVSVVAGGYLFASTYVTPWVALGLSTAFVGATVAPVYAIWMTPEVTNLALVFFAFLLWFHREGVGAERGSMRRKGPWGQRVEACLTHPAAEWVGVAFLALATFSKPPNVLLIGPLVAARAWRGRWRSAAALAAGFCAMVAAAFFLNFLATGEANYQGGARKTFYARFPYDEPGATFDSRGLDMATDDAGVSEMFDPAEFTGRLTHNIVYFFVGRHFGLVPWHFPGALIALLWLLQPRARTAWQVGTAVAIAAVAAGLLVYTPFSWSGGGGPLGNRYFLSVYPALLFLLPRFGRRDTEPVDRAPSDDGRFALLGRLDSVYSSNAFAGGVVAIAWLGGLACTAPALLRPFDVAYRPGKVSERGLPRSLPVELTMITDLPVMLTGDRARLPYGVPPNDVLLYFLDENTWLPERDGGIWVRGGARADVIVRSDGKPVRLLVTLTALAPTRVTLAAGGSARTVEVRPERSTTVTLGVRGAVLAKRTYGIVLSVAADHGTAPHQIDPTSTDTRNLGVQFRFRPVYES